MALVNQYDHQQKRDYANLNGDDDNAMSYATNLFFHVLQIYSSSDYPLPRFEFLHVREFGDNPSRVVLPLPIVFDESLFFLLSYVDELEKHLFIVGVGEIREVATF